MSRLTTPAYRRLRLRRLAVVGLGAAVLAVAAGATSIEAALPSDVRPPTVPQGQVLTVGKTSATMRWNAAVDDVAVIGYRLYLNGAVAGTTKALTFTYRKLRCGTTYTFALEAFDRAGNASNRAEASGTRSTLRCTTQSRPQPRPSPPAAPKAPASSTVANLWVDPNGGSCVRRATRGRWIDGQACSWSAAYRRAHSGDLILVRGGSYGDVEIKPGRAVSRVTFRTAKGERAVIRDFENGHVLGRSGASSVNFIGPVTARTFRSDRASNVLVDRWRVDCGGCIGIQTFHIEDANNVTVRNSDISDNTDNSLVWISGSNLRFENNRIHDAGLRPGSGAHTECMYAWQVTNLTLKRNHFYNCAIMDVFITGGAVSSGGYVENNVFERPWSSTGRVSDSALSFHFRNGGDPSPDPNDWDFLYNTFVGPLSVSGENPVGPRGMRLIGNAFLDDETPCGKANTTFSHNAFVSRPCGANSVLRNLNVYRSGFATSFGLLANSVLRDKGHPRIFPKRDRAGKARPRGAGADIGAYEFG